MEREYCQTCSMLHDFYQIKLNSFLLAARSSSSWSRDSLVGWDPGVLERKEEALVALRCLMRHTGKCPRVSYHAEVA
jgi:hypothetical protein